MATLGCRTRGLTITTLTITTRTQLLADDEHGE